MAKAKKFGIGTLATELLIAGFSAQETLDRVHRVFPPCPEGCNLDHKCNATTLKCIYWYASQSGVKLNRDVNRVVVNSAKDQVLEELREAREAAARRVVERQKAEAKRVAK